ncbi:MAG: hypothetical protein J5765_02815 [Clostridia bacterium]|nr:hypothetical protein [Clostridia bacterium]
MVKAIVDEILAAEARADEIVAAATQRAKEIRERGEKEREEILADAKKEAAALLSTLEAETEAAAQKAESLAMERGAKEAAAVRQSAAGRVTDAAKEISERVLAKYGVTAL